MRRAEQAGIDEVEDRPEIASRFSTGVPVSAIRACALSCFDRLGLLGAGILDRLRLVQDGQLPRASLRAPARAAAIRSW